MTGRQITGGCHIHHLVFYVSAGWVPSSSSRQTSVSALCLQLSSSSSRGSSLCTWQDADEFMLSAISVWITWVLFGFCVCARHEYISGYYRVSVYFLAKILSDITMRTITSVIFSSLVYFLIGIIGSYLHMNNILYDRGFIK